MWRHPDRKKTTAHDAALHRTRFKRAMKSGERAKDDDWFHQQFHDRFSSAKSHFLIADGSIWQITYYWMKSHPCQPRNFSLFSHPFSQCLRQKLAKLNSRERWDAWIQAAERKYDTKQKWGVSAEQQTKVMWRAEIMYVNQRTKMMSLHALMLSIIFHHLIVFVLLYTIYCIICWCHSAPQLYMLYSRACGRNVTFVVVINFHLLLAEQREGSIAVNDFTFPARPKWTIPIQMNRNRHGAFPFSADKLSSHFPQFIFLLPCWFCMLWCAFFGWRR